MFGLNTIQLVGASIVGVFLLTGGAYVKGRVDGRSLGAVDAIKAQNEQFQERSETDADVNKLDRYGLCVDLLGRVPDCDEFR